MTAPDLTPELPDADFEVLVDTVCITIGDHRGTCHRVATALASAVARMVADAWDDGRASANNVTGDDVNPYRAEATS